MTKQILMLTSTWDSDYSRDVISGILDRIGNDDVELHICNAYDNLMETDFFRKGREIYSLPDPERYDGLIIALSSLDSVKYVSEITEKFRNHNKPVVSIDTRCDDALFCGLDNYRSMYQLVEHMITIHDCRIFNYLGGPEDNFESNERFRAFCDCLNEHDIKVSKRRVLHKRFWKTDGANAYNEWKEMRVHMADAVICANDYMALGFVEEALKDGITIPDYMKVTGFDNIEEVQMYSPSITSVNRNRKALGFDATDALLLAMEGDMDVDTRFVEGYVSFNESCGCEQTRNIRNDYNKLIERGKKETEARLIHSYIKQILFKCRTMDEYAQAMEECKEMVKIDDVAVCLNHSFFEGDPDMDVVGFEEDMILFSDGNKTEIKRSNDLYPPEWRNKDRVFLFGPLRSNNQTFGYTVMPYKDDFFTRLKHRSFVESLSLSLESLNQKLAIARLKKG